MLGLLELDEKNIEAGKALLRKACDHGQKKACDDLKNH